MTDNIRYALYQSDYTVVNASHADKEATQTVTQARMLKGIRELIPNHFLLVPGVGAQGGSLEEVARYGMNDRCGLLVNSSRGIIYADRSELFADTAAKKAAEMAAQMAELLSAHGL